MSELLTLTEFRKIRDEIAIQNMKQRLSMLKVQHREVYGQYVNLRNELNSTKDRSRIEQLNYALYIKPSGEYGDHGGIAWQWQDVSAQMDDILRDKRYKIQQSLF